MSLRERIASVLASMPAHADCYDEADAVLAELGPELAPAGFALVPARLTDEMHCRAVNAAMNSVGAADWPQKVLDAIMEAAPQPSPQADPVATYMSHRLTPEGTKEFWGTAERELPPGTKLYAAPQPQPQASAEDVALLDELVKYYSAGVQVPDAWQRIRAKVVQS